MTTDQNTTNMDKKAAQIAALLAKAERTDNPHEAEAYTRKAEELMVRHGIEEAMARAAHTGDVRPEQIVEHKIQVATVARTIGTFDAADLEVFTCTGACGQTLPVKRFITKNGTTHRFTECRKCRDTRVKTTGRMIGESNAYNREHVGGMSNIARAFGARAYFVGDYAAVYLVGFETDVTNAETLIASLRMQVTTAMWSWWNAEGREATAGYPGERERTAVRRNFIHSFYRAVCARLAERTKVETDAIPGSALALRDKEAEVQDHMDAMNLRTTRGRSYSASGAGMRAGQNANLGGPTLGGGRTAISA